MPSQEWLQITLGAILVNNIVLTRILGVCPFLGVSKNLKTALGMSGAVVFVMTVSSCVTALLDRYLLSSTVEVCGYALELSFTRILMFIVVIASLVQSVEILLKRFSPKLNEALGIYLPLITTNCAVLGVATINSEACRGVLASTVFGCCAGIGFGLALLLFASLRERLELSKIPAPFRGTAIALITAGILSLAFIGFSGLVR